MPLSAKDRLLLIRVKTERAKYHLDNLEVEAKLNQGLYEHALFRSSKNRGTMYRLPVVNPALSLALGTCCITCVPPWIISHWQLVEANGGEPDRETAFPIAENAREFVATRRKRMKGMSAEAKKAIKDLQPYKEGNRPLWLIITGTSLTSTVICLPQGTGCFWNTRHLTASTLLI